MQLPHKVYSYPSADPGGVEPDKVCLCRFNISLSVVWNHQPIQGSSDSITPMMLGDTFLLDFPTNASEYCSNFLSLASGSKPSACMCSPLHTVIQQRKQALFKDPNRCSLSMVTSWKPCSSTTALKASSSAPGAQPEGVRLDAAPLDIFSEACSLYCLVRRYMCCYGACPCSGHCRERENPEWCLCCEVGPVS